MKLPLTGVVLAGGASKRMGKDKAFLELDGRPLVARQVERLQEIFDCVIICANDTARFAPYALAVVPDEGGPGGGPLGAIASAVRASPTSHAFCCAVDMPFLSTPLVRHMASLSPWFDVVIPRGDATPGKRSTLEPLHAIYSKRCYEPFARRVAEKKLKVDEAFEGLRVRVLEWDEVTTHDPERRSFRNMNTPEEFAAVARELKEGPP